MSDTPAPAPGASLVRVGGVLFALGALSTLATMAPLLLGTDPLPPVAWFLSMLMGVGFLVAAAGVLRGIAAQRRQARSSVVGVSDRSEGTWGTPGPPAR